MLTMTFPAIKIRIDYIIFVLCLRLFVVVFHFVFVVNNSFEVACGVCGVYVDA